MCNPNSLLPYAATAEMSMGDISCMQGTRMDCHALLLLRRCCCCNMDFGRTKDDFAATSVVFLPYGRTVDLGKYSAKGYSSAHIASFTPLLCREQHIGLADYPFLHYNANEALHLSKCETDQLLAMLDHIRQETTWPADEYTAAILAKLVALTLDLCLRFYARQNITRATYNHNIINKVYAAIDNHLALMQSCAHACTAPTAQSIAALLGHSTDYLEQTCKAETGMTVAEIAKLRKVEKAKEMLLGTSLPVATVASKLGFCSVDCLRQIFEKTMGVTPEQFRICR